MANNGKMFGSENECRDYERTLNTEIRKVKQHIDEIVETCLYIFDKPDGGIRIYPTYDEINVFSNDRMLKNIMKDDFPKDAFYDYLNEWEMDYMVYYADEIENQVKAELSENELVVYEDNEEELRQYLYDWMYGYYEPEDFNCDVKVNIMVDCGNRNYDYTSDNVLNYYGQYSGGTMDNTSSISWLAKQQGKYGELRHYVRATFNGHDASNAYDCFRVTPRDEFIESCLDELENLSSSCGTLTFLVEMKLFDLFALLEMQKAEYDEKAEYDPRKNKSESYIVLGKDTKCGLYDPYNGGGSLLEIELDKDVKLPLKYAVICPEKCKMNVRYDVDEVYGLVGSTWKDTLKEIHKDERYYV